MNEVTKNFRDAAYVFVGLGVVGFQQLQARSEALRARLATQRTELDKQLEDTRALLTDVAKDFENRIEPLRESVEGRIATLRTRLNGAAA